jgi:hypothetical protein
MILEDKPLISEVVLSHGRQLMTITDIEQVAHAGVEEEKETL